MPVLGIQEWLDNIDVRGFQNIAIALALALTVSCASNGRVSALSEHDLISRVNTVCRTAKRATPALRHDASQQDVDAYVDAIRTVVDTLSTISPPEQLRTKFDAFTAVLEDFLTQAGSLSVASTGPAADASNAAIVMLKDLAPKVSSAASALGVTDCNELTSNPAGVTDYRKAAEKAFTDASGEGSTATCDAPAADSVGTTFNCVGVGADGTTFALIATIDKQNHVLVNSAPS